MRRPALLKASRQAWLGVGLLTRVPRLPAGGAVVPVLEPEVAGGVLPVVPVLLLPRDGA